MSTSEVEVFGPVLEEARRSVEHNLDQYTRFESSCPQRLAEAMRYSLLSPGKRLRPLLVLAATHVCGGSIEAALPAACSVEMIHTYSLIHDDLPAMDDDDLRRGKASCHIEFDEATAILAGDALITLAFEVMARNIRPVNIALKCVEELSVAAGACRLVGGQSDDLKLQNSTIDLEKLESIHRRKTGALFTVSLRLGGFCAQGTADQLESLTEYGNHLGLAFQITDDLLDLCGDEVKIGKRTRKDSKRGKQTYPDLIGIDASRQLARELGTQAINSIKPFGKVANDLIRFANFVIDRNY